MLVAAGLVVLLLCLADIYVTVFNYDGFTFLAGRLHRTVWAVLRASSRVLPAPAQAGYLSLGSAAMLPLTLAWWLALEVIGFALLYLHGLGSGGLVAHGRTLHDVQGAFYLSGGDLTSLTFGDIVARSGGYRAAVDMETVIGLATFTIGLTYVLAAFDAFGTLNELHGRVRRHAIEPNRPVTILARHFRAGDAQQLPTLLQSLSEDLAAYDDALRRYPVVFFFHTRREQRSIPRIFAALAELIELLRWGLPADQPVTTDPYLMALQNQYVTTARRLLRSFVGPPDPGVDDPLPFEEFRRRRPPTQDGSLSEFLTRRREALDATGVRPPRTNRARADYDQYREWHLFHARRSIVITRLRAALCYPDGH